MVNPSVRKQEPMPVCRTCMTRGKRRQKQVPIFSKLNGTFIASIITDCTSVEIEENDSLPAVICTDCFETLKLLVAFVKTARDTDGKLRHQLCKVEPVPDKEAPAEETDTTAAHFLEIKTEPEEKEEAEDEEMVDETGPDDTIESDDGEPDNDTDTDWKGSDKEVEERTVKRRRVGLKSKPTPPKKPRVNPMRAKLVQSEDDLKLNEQEQELFSVIEVAEGSHVCCGCLQVFMSAEELEAHRKMEHIKKIDKPAKPNTKLTCQGCLHKFISDRSMKLHQDKVRLLKVIWECNKCQTRFKATAKRREHLKVHDAEPVALKARVRESTIRELGWICCGPKCNESFQSEMDLIAHGLAAHSADREEIDEEADTKPEQCQVCFKRFETMKKVVCHQRRKYKFANFQCAQCGEKFVLQQDLQKHDALEHGNYSFKCEVCDKVFTTKGTLKAHMKNMHTDEKPHQCTVCGMTFRQKGGLTMHMSTHIETPQLKCKVCSKMFKMKLHLRYHMRTHTGEKPYKCRFCDHAFANNTNCKRHEMTHTGDKPHKCSYCEKSFILKRLLIEHENVHTGEPRTVSVRKPRTAPKAESNYQIETIEVGDEGDESSDSSSNHDYNYQEPFRIGNRKISIRVVNPTKTTQPTNVAAVQQTTTTTTPVQYASTSSVTLSPGTLAVYNVVPSSTPGTYYLKY